MAIMCQRTVRKLVDIAVYVAVQTVMVLVSVDVIQPVWRGFFCDDETIRYRYKPDTVSSSMLYIAFLVVVPVTITVVECYVTWRRRTCFNDVTSSSSSSSPSSRWRLMATSTLSVFCLFWFGLSVTMLVTEIGKLSTGRLRPHFIDVCRPDFTAINCSLGYIEQYTCSNASDTWKLIDARKSFPSSHSSLSVYTAVYLSFYFRRRLDSDYSVLCVYVAEMVVCTVAMFTCLSRVTDNMHHSSDVICGAALGVVVAVWNIQLLQQHYAWSRVTSSNADGRHVEQSNKNNISDDKTKMELKRATDVDAF